MKFKIKFADQIVGALSVIAIAALVFIIFFIGSKQKWFVPKHPFYTIVSSASSISKEMQIQYKGFGIGKVTDIGLDDNDNVKVSFYISDEYIDRITTGSIIEISVSPIGLGSSIIFHPGLGTSIIEDDSLIPELQSQEAKALIENNQIVIQQNIDSITTIIGSAGKLVIDIDTLINQVNELIKGNPQLPLSRTINEINGILLQVNKLLAGDTSVPMGTIIDELSQSIGTLNNILSDVNNLTSDPQGLVPKLLESEDSKGTFDQLFTTINTTISDLNGISGSLDSEMPQVSILLSEVQTLLRQVQDVMEGLKNNPLLKNGVPERSEKSSATPKLRGDEF